MAGAEVGDSYAGELYMAANPEIHQEILELWISIAETKPTSIPYPETKGVASLQQCLSAASDFADAADADKDEEDEEDEEDR